MPLLLLLVSLASCAGSREGVPSTAPSSWSLEVRHTPLSPEDIPTDLLERLRQRDYPYVRFYRTDLTNRTDRPIRVVWFDGFFQTDGVWTASNIRNRVLRTRDFLDWYGGEDMTAEGWLRPGGTASCRVNWHWSDTPDDIPTKWGYVAVDAHGNDYFGEAVVPDTRWMKLR